MKNHFDDIAKNWDNQETIERNQQFANQIKDFCSIEGKKILDFGCGTGLLSSYLYSANGQIYGADSSQGMVEQFCQRFSGMHNAHSVCVDIESNDLPADYSDFDLIISAMAFHHLTEPKKVLFKLAASLKHNGHCFVFDLEEEDGSFHPDNISMGVKHFGFSEQTQNNWVKESNLDLVVRKQAFSINKNSRDYPIMMTVFKKVNK